jgi:Tfp pilus assembly protein PilN
VNRALNLARRPFRNERLPTLALGLGCLVLLGVTVRHGFAAWNLMPGQALSVEHEAVALEAELASLRTEAEQLSGQSQAAAPVKEWAAVKDLVDRRAFSWTGLFGDLEKALPPSVRLVSIAPQTERGQLVLVMAAVGQDVDDALALLAALQGHPHFRDAQLLGYSPQASGVEISCRAAYEPPRAAAATSSGAAKPAGAAAPAAPGAPAGAAQ